MAKIFQFKITLSGTKPPLWRRFQVPSDYNFFEFHSVIQNVMGWSGVCLHKCFFDSLIDNSLFEIKEDHPEDTRIDEYLFSNFPIPAMPSINELNVKLSEYFKLNDKDTKVLYEYDFISDWEHELFLEKILDPEEGVKYPVCLDGARACPPEKCGGIKEYHQIVKNVKKDKTSARYKVTMDYVRASENYMGVEHYDTEKFDPADIDFSIVHNNPERDD